VSQRNKHVIERLAEDSITIRKALIETSDKMLAKFKDISTRMDNEVDILNRKIAMIFNDLRNVESNMIRTNLALAHLAGPYTTILNQAVNNLRSYFTEIKRLSDGIVSRIPITRLDTP
jgi:ABC-type ATPase involved in cell division